MVDANDASDDQADGMPLDLKDTDYTFSHDRFTYNGKVQRPLANLSYQGTVLARKVGYSANVPSSVDVGKYTVTWTAKASNNKNGEYALMGSQMGDYWIDPAPLNVTLDGELSYEYDGQPHGPIYKIDESGVVDGKLSQADVITTYAKDETNPQFNAQAPTEPGNYLVSYYTTGDGENPANPAWKNYKVTETSAAKLQKFTITKLAKPEVSVSMDDWYEGSEVTPEPVVTVTPEGVSYTVSYKENKEGATWTPNKPTKAGSYTIKVVAGGGNSAYEADGVATNTFEVKRKAETELDVMLEGWTYGDEANEPVPTVKVETVGTEVNEDSIVYEYRTQEEGSKWSMDVPGDAGEYFVRATLPAGEAYKEAQSDGKATFTIAPRRATIMVDAKQKYVDAKEPDLTATVDGVLKGDKLDYTLKRNPGEAVGKYLINAYADLAADDSNLISTKATEPTIMGNYAVTQAPNKLTIIAKPNVTAQIDGWTYGETAKESIAKVDGKAPAEGTEVKFEYRAKGAGDDTWSTEVPTKAGDYELRATVGPTTTSTGGTSDPTGFTIAKRPVTLTKIKAESKTYDGTTDATVLWDTAEFDEGDVVGDDDLTITGTGAFKDKNVYRKDGKPSACKVMLSELALGGENADNYVLAEEGQLEWTAATIYPRYVEFVGITAKDKTYDGNTDATITIPDNPFGDKLVAGDDLKLEGLEGKFVDANVDFNKKVELNTHTEGAVTLGGKDAGNYELQINNRQEQTEASIVAKTVTIKAQPATKFYGEADPKLIAEVKGVLHGESEDLIKYELDRKRGEYANKYEITCDFEAIQGNYAVKYQKNYLNIKPCEVTVKANDLTKVYGDPDPELTAKVTGTINNDQIAYELSRDWVGEERGEKVGQYNIHVSGAESQIFGNYHVTFEDGMLSITPKAATVTANDQTIIYGDELPELTYAVEGLVGDDELEVTPPSCSYKQGDDKGEYKITVTAEDKTGNYEVKTKDGKLTVKPMAITIKAGDGSKTYGDPSVKLGYEITEGKIVNDGDLGEIKVTREDKSKDVGVYDTTVDYAKNPNYDVSVETGVFEIVPARVTVKPIDNGKQFGKDDPELTATVDGLQYGEQESTIDYGLKRERGEDAGTYEIVASGEALQGNYAVSFGKAKFTINRKPVTIVAHDKSKVYGEPDPELTATVYGLVGNDGFAYRLERDAGEHVGEYPIRVIVEEGDERQGNYELVGRRDGKQTIGAKAATIKVSDLVIAYGDDMPYTILTSTVEGAKDEEIERELKVEAKPENLSASGHLKVGTYPIVADYETDQGNYAVGCEKGTLTVLPRAVTYDGIRAKDKVYDGSTKAKLDCSAAKFDNIMDGDELAITAKGTFDGKDVGKHKVNLTGLKLGGASAANYVLAKEGQQKTATAKITKATLTVTAKDKTIKFGQAPKNAGVTYAGFIKGEDKSVLGGKLAYDYGGYAKGSYAGTYKITPSGLTSANYKISYKRGKLTVTAPKQAGDTYVVHARKIGDMDAASNGEVAGTTGESRRLEALGISLRLTDQPYAGGIEYRSHLRHMGWLQAWERDGAFSGTKGESRRLEAVQIRLYGNMAKRYDVYYRVHVRNYGWMAWAKNGMSAGTTGGSRRAEAIQVVVLKKGSKAPGANYKGVKQTYPLSFEAR